jgi:hypothetical protein
MTELSSDLIEKLKSAIAKCEKDPSGFFADLESIGASLQDAALKAALDEVIVRLRVQERLEELSIEVAFAALGFLMSHLMLSQGADVVACGLCSLL